MTSSPRQSAANEHVVSYYAHDAAGIEHARAAVVVYGSEHPHLHATVRVDESRVEAMALARAGLAELLVAETARLQCAAAEDRAATRVLLERLAKLRGGRG